MANEQHFQLGIKALIKNPSGQILLLEADPTRGDGNFYKHWDLPGGRVQEGDSVEETLLREVEEEMGIKEIKIIRLIDASIGKMKFRTGEGLILFTYLCEMDPTLELTLSPEHLRFKWFPQEEAAELLNKKFSDGLVEAVKKL
jgi:8-oxo-dGTP diphosphatase